MNPIQKLLLRFFKRPFVLEDFGNEFIMPYTFHKKYGQDECQLANAVLFYLLSIYLSQTMETRLESL